MKPNNKDLEKLIRCSEFYKIYMNDNYTCEQLSILIDDGFKKLKTNISYSDKEILEEQMKAITLVIHDKRVKGKGIENMSEEEIRSSMDYKIFNNEETSIEDLEKLIENLHYIIDREPNLLNDKENEIVKLRISAIELIIADRNTKKRN